MRHNLRRATTAALALLCLFASANAAARVSDATLPLEFFWGRWAQGLSISSSCQLREDYSPAWDATIRYTYRSFRAKFDGRVLDSGSYFEPWSVSAESARLAYRPSAPIQLRLGLRHYERSRDYQSSVSANRRGYQPDENALSLGADWSRHDILELPEQNSAYAYLVSPMLAGGEALVSIDLSLSDDDAQEKAFDKETGANTYEGSSSETVCSTSVALLLSLSDRLTFAANVFAMTSRESATSISRDDLPETPDFKDEYRNEADVTTYNARASVRAMTGLFVSTGVSQKLARTSRHIDRIMPTYDAAYRYDDPFRVTTTNVNASFDLITNGRFNSNIILDDYQNYYRHMLFEGQWHARLAVEANLPNDSFRFDVNTVAVRSELTFGLSSHVNLSGWAVYRWSEYDRKNNFVDSFEWEESPPELITSAINVRLRSFRYDPPKGAGWHNDASLDIAFGPLPRAGHAWLDIEYRPDILTKQYDKTATETARFFAFDGLRPIDGQSVTFDGEAGIGYRTSFGGSLQYQIFAHFQDPYTFTARLRSRILGSIEFAAGYEYEYTRFRRHSERGFVRIRGVF